MWLADFCVSSFSFFYCICNWCNFSFLCSFNRCYFNNRFSFFYWCFFYYW